MAGFKFTMNEKQKEQIKEDVLREVGFWMKANQRVINPLVMTGEIAHKVREKLIEVTIEKTEERILENMAE